MRVKSNSDAVREIFDGINGITEGEISHRELKSLLKRTEEEEQRSCADNCVPKHTRVMEFGDEKQLSSHD